MKLSILLMSLLLIPGWVVAGSEDGKTEVSIYSGISFLDAEQEFPGCIFCRPEIFPPFASKSSFDSGFLIGFKVGHYLNKNVEVEGNFAVAPNQDFRIETFFECPPGEICPLWDQPASIFPFYFEQRNGVSYYYDGNIVYNFPCKNITPFVTVGIGGVSTDIELENKTDFSFNFGAGAKTYFKNIGLRFEVNDHVISDHFFSEETEHDVQVQYGFLFRL